MTNAPVIAIHIILNDIKDKDEKKEFIESVKKENPQAYKEYQKQKQKLETIKLYPYRINRERLRERLQELKDLKEYVPTRLGFTLGAYTEITDTIKEEYEDCARDGSYTQEWLETLDAAIKALKQEPVLEKDGTLVVTTEHYKDVARVLVQYGTNGSLFYQD